MVRIKAVASRKLDTARTYVQQYDIPVAYGSYGEMLNDPEIDVVYISLPNALHIEWVKHALNAGKHVLCEKPLSPRPREVEEVFELARDAGRRLAEGYMYRHHPQIARVQSIIDARSVGPVRLIRASFSFPADPVADRHLLSGDDGGSLLDVGCYCVDLARLLCGEPEVVQAEQVLTPGGVDVRFGAVMRFANGALCLFDSGLDIPQRESLEIACDVATITLTDPWAQGRDAKLVIAEDVQSCEEEFGVVDAYRLEIDEFARDVQERGRCGIDAVAEDAINQAVALDCLRQSAVRRRSVSVKYRIGDSEDAVQSELVH
jgi:predicted dehydrogenase